MVVWLKAFHIIAMVCWFAGLFYLPRLFVYHATANDEISQVRFKIMERRLFYGIMAPSAILTVLFGLGLFLLNPTYYMAASWMTIKLFFVATLIVYHLYCGYCVNRFKRDENPHSPMFYRWFNEYPAIVLLVVVILVCVKF